MNKNPLVIWEMYRDAKYLTIISGFAGVLYLIFTFTFLRGKVYDESMSGFLYFWLFVVIPASVANAILERLHRRYPISA
jgi:hypothetical protein